MNNRIYPKEIFVSEIERIKKENLRKERNYFFQFFYEKIDDTNKFKKLKKRNGW